jgi:hypothetical protein
MSPVRPISPIPRTMRNTPKIRVIAHDGYKANERPAAVVLDGERLEVREIEDSWIAAGVDPKTEITRGFVVRCDRGIRFRLKHCDERGWIGEVLPGPRLAIK